MKGFNVSGAKYHSFMKRFLLLCLAVCFTVADFQGISIAAATEGDGGLLSLSVSGVSVIDFDPSQTVYTLYIPRLYEEGEAVTPEVPEVYAVTADGTDVDISYPDNVEGGSVTVTVTPFGGTPVEYTLQLELIGENLYENGGFENAGVNFSRAADNVPLTRVDEDAFYGSYSAKIPTNYSLSGFKYNTQQQLLQDKTYISSYATRMAVGETPANPYRLRDFVISKDSSQQASVNFYLNGSKYESREPAQKHEYSQPSVNLSENWLQLQAVITPITETYDALHYFQDSGTRKASALLDDFFLGELVVAKGIITDDTGADIGKLVKPEEGTADISLSAAFYNQLGNFAGLEDLSVSRWELAEDYDGVSINDDGVLTYDINAPSSVIVRACADMQESSSQSNGVKAETVITFADASDLVPAELADIRIGGYSIPGFTSGKSNYNMYIPYTYNPLNPKVDNTPAVEATPVFEGTTYSVTYPHALDGGIISITATAEDGTEKTYNIVMHTVGENKYENSGFEAEGHSYGPIGSAVKADKITDNPGSGNYSLAIGFKGATNGFIPQANLEAGKTYFSSRMIRKTENTVFNDSSESEDIFYRFDNYQDRVVVYFGGEEIDNQGGYRLVPTDNWKNFYAVLYPKSDWSDKQMFHTGGWAAWNYLALDNCFLGELTVSDIEYLGDDRAAIPDSGELTYPLNAKLKNQMGTHHGLENESVSWALAYPYDGVYIEDDELVITDEAREQTIYVRATVEPSFGDGYAVAKSFEVELLSESANAETPRALHVKAEGVIASGETLTGSYTYHNVKNIEESGTTYAWFYSDTETGPRYPIPNETSQTLYIGQDYIDEYYNKFIFFCVTPSTVEGRLGSPAMSNFLMKPVTPEAEGVSISCDGYVGSTATGNYRFLDKNGDEEEGTAYRWLRYDSTQSKYVAIEGAVEKTYIITEDDIDTPVRFEVKPRTNVEPTGEENDVTFVSEPFILAAKPIVTDVTIHEIDKTTYRVSYKYEHPLDIEEGVCLVKWYVDGAAAGTDMSQRINGNTKTLTVVVTPVAAKAPLIGDDVTKKIEISSSGRPASGHITNSGGGGSGGSFGGGNKLVPIPEKPQETIVTEPVKHWAADGIEFVTSRSIMQEPVPGDFCNTQLVTRSDFVFYVMKTLGYQESSYKHEFKDVTGNDYYAGYLQTAVNEGIISKDVNFNPERDVSREEICKILVLALKLQGKQSPDLSRFADSGSITEWARGYVEAAVEAGLLKGVSETEFSPLGRVTREQTAVILKRIFDYKNGGVIS